MKTFYSILFFVSFVFIGCNDEYTSIENSSDQLKKAKEQLGEKLFSETQLSNPEGQSCASCHAPEMGFSDPQHQTISHGVITNLFGKRNAPSLSYNVFAPQQYYNSEDETFVGGFFLDGRASSLEKQVLGPLFNPLEMNNSSIASLANKIRSLSYFNELTAIYGETTDDNTLVNQLANAIATFEKSTKVNSFTSKFDYVSKGLMTFTADELKGLNLYTGKAKCSQCHPVEEDEQTGKILLTDFTYDNLGVPKNTQNPFYSMPSNINPEGYNFIDNGLGTVLNSSLQNGKFKVPSLRNVAITAPYFHNGVYNTLDEVIHFYNKRDVENLGQPETAMNVNTSELGNLQLTPVEEQQLKKFLETLTDHYRQ